MPKSFRRRGEVWLLNREPTLGAEMKKTRPVVMLSHDRLGVLPLRVIVPLTQWQERYAVAPWMIKIEPTVANGILTPSSADTFQVRSVATQRFVKKLGELSAVEMESIAQGLATVLVIR